MNRLVLQATIKLCAESISFAVIIGVAIGIIGYLNKWNSSIAYSNAFFLAGCFMIIAGTMSRFAASQQGSYYQTLNAESFREMSSSERVNFIIDLSSSLRTLLVGVLTGLLLLLVSAFAASI